MSATEELTNPDEILGNYKRMMADCQQIAAKISELNYERDEHKLVVDILGKLESERKAFRLVGSVLVERTVGDVLPTVSQNFEGIKELLGKLDESWEQRDEEGRQYKETYGITPQEDREAMMKNQNKLTKKLFI
eukprot:gene13348-15442_t